MYIIITYYHHIYYHILAFISITNPFILSYTGGYERRTNAEQAAIFACDTQPLDKLTDGVCCQILEVIFPTSG